MARRAVSPRYVVFAAEGVAIILLGLGAWLGSHEFVGEFGRTGQSMECGSVWGLPTNDGLNAATCVGDLRDRVTLVAAIIGAAGVVALATPTLVLRQSARSRLLVVAVAFPLALSLAMLALWRHFIWRVTGA